MEYYTCEVCGWACGYRELLTIRVKAPLGGYITLLVCRACFYEHDPDDDEDPGYRHWSE